MPSNPYHLLSASTACLLIPKQHFSYVSNSISVISHFTCLASTKPFLRFDLRFPSQLQKRRDVFSVFGLKKLGKGETALMDDEDEMDDEFDDFVEDNEDEDEDEDDIDEDEDEEMFVPLGNMKQWLENKPRGFGEGKVYDTSIEDKLFDEIQQSKKAQAANVDNLKRNPVNPAKDIKKKATELAPSGIRVCVSNLPKKKNIDRDLRSAFKEVPGIVNIIPAVSGNKKTKDPICKGFAFVDFKSQELADRFIQQFSGYNVAFGRIEKPIKCSMAKSQTSTSSDDDSSRTSPIPYIKEEYVKASVTIGEPLSEEETDEFVPSESQISSDSDENFSSSESVNGKTMSPKMKPTIGSFNSGERDKKQVSKKKKASKVKEPKVPKLEIPGSAKRLKIKEKSVLIDVFSKYGSQSTLVSGGES